MNCIIQAWEKHETELRLWLTGKIGNTHDAEDILQSLFMKAVSQDKKFCELNNPRAWLFQVARNTLVDRFRLQKNQIDLPDDLVEYIEEPATVDDLTQCLPRALSELSKDDREAIIKCDLEGMTQQEFAKTNGISLSGAKSRVQRARQRLRDHLSTACQVRFDESGKICCFVPRSTPD